MESLDKNLAKFVFIPNLSKKKKLDSIIADVQNCFNNLRLPEYFDYGLKFAITPEEILEVMKLRSKIYTSLGYNKQFPEEINGLNYDDFDRHSLILISRNKNNIVGSLRIVFDSLIGLPSEKMISINNWKKNLNFAELSRLVVDPNFRSGDKENGSLAFNQLFAGTYWTSHLTDLDRYLMVMKDKHAQRYLEFGGVTNLGSTKYGNLDQDSQILLWNPSLVGDEFSEKILGKKLDKVA